MWRGAPRRKSPPACGTLGPGCSRAQLLSFSSLFFSFFNVFESDARFVVMSLKSLPHIADLHSETDLDQTDVLDLLFEPSPAIHEALLPVIRTAEYLSYEDLIDACQIGLLSLAAASSIAHPDPTLISVLGSHPRLGEKKIDSAASAAEQANLQGGANVQHESEELARLNREYEAAFPGLRYVVFVNGRGRPEIMQDMRTRIARNDMTKEVDAAIQVRHPRII